VWSYCGKREHEHDAPPSGAVSSKKQVFPPPHEPAFACLPMHVGAPAVQNVTASGPALAASPATFADVSAELAVAPGSQADSVIDANNAMQELTRNLMTFSIR
jgi:hypothetical protein